MSNSIPWYLNTRLILGIVIILSLTGLAGWNSAYNQEDPHFPYRNGFVSISSAGMSVQQLNDALVKPTERVLSQIDEINNYSARIKAGFAIIDIELREEVYDTETVWQRIKERMAPMQMSAENAHIFVQDRAQDTQGIVLSIDSGGGLLNDRELAIEVRDELLRLSSVRNVTLVGDPSQQLVIEYAHDKLIETGITPAQIAARLRQSNSQSTPGTLAENTTSISLSPLSRLANEQHIGDKLIATVNGGEIPLSSIANIKYDVDPTATEQFWMNGKQVIGLAITLPPNRVQVEQVGQQIKAAVERINSRFIGEPVKIELYQPDWSKQRRDGLLNSLLLSSLAVAVILLCLMSMQSAIIVSLAIPAITLSALALFTSFDGVIHQMTIAGMVLSLGLMVDNCIVVAERMTYYQERGEKGLKAAIKSVAELKQPLASATLTTIAAFVPMLISKGSVADFIATIPLLVIICIVVSYFIAMTFVPVVFQKLNIDIPFLNKVQNTIKVTLDEIGLRIANFSLQRTKLTFLLCLVGITGLMSIPGQPGEFFPKTNRNQAYVDIQLPFGSHIDATTTIANEIAEYLDRRQDITDTMVFSGFSGPRFYYNLAQQPNETHIARVVFESTLDSNMNELVAELNQVLKPRYRSIILNARELGQGPPIESPIELRLSGSDTGKLQTAAEALLDKLREESGLTNLRREYTFGSPQLTLDFDQQLLTQLGLTEDEMTQYTAWRSSGLTVTQLDFTQEPISLVLRDPSSSQSSTDLLNTQVVLADGATLPISALAKTSIEGIPAFVQRRNGQKVITILSDVEAGFDEEEILEELAPTLMNIASENGVYLEFGGEMEETEDANNALFKTLPAGLVLLFIALVIQFNSLRLTFLVMLSIPLGILGAPAMLAVVGIPFGFMSILGVLALTGIVVNTAILLIESAMQNLANGLDRHQAIQLAVQNRIRPVIVTTVTTIVGMLPLTSSASPLWPPLAWAVIGGLITSTILMLFVMPALMNLMIGEARQEELQHA
ncbi:efflux RND transporter permease subunit [Pseudoalteromonas sp. T1lg65]|uniref:efflux RND transporter permease subunit n=1 Tax=Pseudoalteromonas sp. T1lg65 TaxID=2077101 RepID=UPI003F7A4C66